MDRKCEGYRETLKSSKIVTIEQYYNETFKSE